MLRASEEIPEDFELPVDRITYHDDGSVTYRLRYPPTIKFRGPDGEREEVVAELTFRRLNGEDLELSERSKSGMAASGIILRRLTGISEAVNKKLDAYDLLVAAVIIGNFTMTSRLTGGVS